MLNYLYLTSINGVWLGCVAEQPSGLGGCLHLRRGRIRNVSLRSVGILRLLSILIRLR